MTCTLHLSDCLSVMRAMPAETVDAVVTDPPYELGFMDKRWDATGIAYSVEMWREALRILKPGGNLLAFGGTRTSHRMVCAIEDAGFEIRDSIHWLYGSGFPKSLNVSKAIDKRIGVERVPNGTVTIRHGGGAHSDKIGQLNPAIKQTLNTIPVTAEAIRFEGWGTALKPAHEPIVLARKPLDGTVAANVLAHGTGGLNVDGCRVDRATDDVSGWSKTGSVDSENRAMLGRNYSRPPKDDAAGRWPPNLLLTHSVDCGETCAPGCPVAELDRQSGTLRSGTGSVKQETSAGYRPTAYGAESRPAGTRMIEHTESLVGGASRFFPVFHWDPALDAPFLYCAKPSRSERDAGCGALPECTGGETTDREEGSAGLDNPRAGAGRTGGAKNYHPTVKPVALMRWLVQLVTPPGGLVLDPFLGSGTTGVAAVKEGFEFIGIERESGYVEIAHCRIDAASKQLILAPAAPPSPSARARPGSGDGDHRATAPARSPPPDRKEGT